MRVLITGINGFIGGHLRRALEAAEHEVFGLSLTPPHESSIFEGNLLNLASLERVVLACNPDVVVHLAGLSHVGESFEKPGEYLRVNFTGTCNLLKAVGARRLIYASSSEVYGCVPEAEQPITEDRPVEPLSPYAMVKACAEQVALAHGAIVVRSFNTIGVGQAARFALPSFAGQLAAIARGDQEAKIQVGDLTPRRDFLHVADAAEGYRILIERGEPGQIYNLARGEACSIADALDALRNISGVSARVERDAARVRPVDIPLLLGDHRRMAALGWEPRLRLEDALQELWKEARQASGGKSP